MKSAALLAIPVLVACSPVTTAPIEPTPPSKAVEPSDAATDAASSPTHQETAVPSADTRPTSAPRFSRVTVGGIAIEAVTFDSRSHHLVVADQPDGPGSRWPDSRAAGSGGLAAINASFFNPDGSPLGLVVTSGNRRGALNRASSLGSGFFVETTDGHLALIRRDRFSGAREAIQCGPFLVEGDRPVAGLSEKTASARSFIATDGRNRWVIARTGPCSLVGLAEALAGSEIQGVPVRTALNLDGGRSSDLWVSSSVSGGPVHTRPLWNKPVRNFLILRKR